MPDIGDIISISRQVYTPAFYSMLILFTTGVFLKSGALLNNAADRVVSLITAEGQTQSQFSRTAFFVCLFLISPQVFSILGLFSPVTFEYVGTGLIHNVPTHDDRLAEIWCAFPLLAERQEVENFMLAVTAKEYGTISPWEIDFSRHMHAHLVYFSVAVTSLVTVFVSGLASVWLKPYRTFAPLKLAVVVLSAILIMVDAYTSQSNGFSQRAERITSVAHSALMREGNLNSVTEACISEKMEELRDRDWRITSVSISPKWPSLSSIIPFESED